MSKLLDRFRYFKQKGDTFADGHGQVMYTNRDWEDSYRQRWQFDKIVRSTHGVNCTGSCSWKIYVKNGLVTWETQQTDYPRTRPDLPNHEPRGCPRGASYSWYLYSANRLKYPLVRKRLIELWREALSRHSDPVLAWESIMNDPQKCQILAVTPAPSPVKTSGPDVKGWNTHGSITSKLNRVSAIPKTGKTSRSGKAVGFVMLMAR